MNRWHGYGSLIACVLGVVLGGCSAHTDPRFDQRTAQRLATIDRVLDRLAAREAEAPARLAAVSAVIESGPPRHEANLRRTLETLRTKERRDRERWPRTWSATRERVAHELAGNPASIDDAIPRMFY